MIDGTYKIKINSILGSGIGKVVLRTEGDVVVADIKAPVVGRQHIEASLESENSFMAEGSFWLLLMGTIRYKLRGEVDGDELFIDIKSSRGNIQLTGNRA